MAEIIKRIDKGAPLTAEEHDQNLDNLNDLKLEGSVFSANNTILIRDKDGELVPVVIAEGSILGRLAGGNIKGMTVAEVITLLALATNDIDGLDAALSALSGAITDLETDMTAAESAIADKADATDLNGVSVFAKGTGTLVAGVLAVAVPGMLASDRVLLFNQAPAGDVGALYVDPVSNDEFTAKSTSNTDASTFYYLILREAA